MICGGCRSIISHEEPSWACGCCRRVVCKVCIEVDSHWRCRRCGELLICNDCVVVECDQDDPDEDEYTLHCPRCEDFVVEWSR